MTINAIDATLIRQGDGSAIPVPTAEPDWTVLQPSTDSRIIYVDPNGSGGTVYTYGVNGAGVPGSNDWENPVGEDAYTSVSTAKAQMRDGFPDYILLKKDEEWTQTFGELEISGRSASEPLVISSYGTGARPILNTGSSTGIVTDVGSHPTSTNSFVRLIGIDFYAHTRDPDNPSFVSAGNEAKGMDIRGGMDDWIIEDCLFRFYKNNISIESAGGQAQKNVTIRYNVILDSLSTVSSAQGIFLNTERSGATGSINWLIEGNIIDHNGYSESPNAPAGSDSTIFNHNMYIQQECAPNEMNVRRNIICRASSHALQQRSGGDITDNFVLECPIGLLHGGGTSPVPNLPASDIYGNVIVNAPDMNSGEPRGRGISVENTVNQLISGNYLSQVLGSAPVGIVLASNGTPPSPATGTITGNVIHDWGSYDTGVPSDYADPNRTVESYNQSIGGLATKADFYANLRLQSKDSWNSDYSVESINQYFIDGFAPA